MRFFAVFFVLLLFPVGISHGKTYGPATVMAKDFDRNAALDSVFAKLVKAPDEVTSRLIADKMWLIFMMAPDAQTAEDMNRALRARGGYNFDKALGILNGMIERHPSYAEAWNQRAYIHFLKQNYAQSITDCETTLELEPRHIGCLSGMARIFIRHLNRPKAGAGMLRRAMELHPWIHERVLLKELPGTDL